MYDFEKMILDSSCNPNTGNMSNMLQNISSQWKNIFDQRVKDSGEKDKLNSLVQLRNDFAHGDSISVSIDTVINYFDSATNILHILCDVISGKIGAWQCALQGLEIIRVETPSGKELTTPPVK